MIRLVLVRHGESAWNAEQRIQGQSGTGLSDRGRQQAEAVAQWVADTHPDALIVTSDLQRCVETAAPIVAALACEAEHDVELRERRFGRWEGHTWAEIEEVDPDLVPRWRAGEDVVELAGGESGIALAERAVKAFHRLTELGHDTVVAVTHGGTIWHGLHELLGLPFGTLGGVGNTSVTEVVRFGDHWVLDTWNQQSHLPASLRTSRRPAEQRRSR